MPKIQVDIIDTMGHSTSLPLPNDRPMDDLVESVVSLTGLTETSEDGRKLRYRLFSRRLLKVLSQDGTLYTNGVMEGDQLRIAPEPFEVYLEFEMLTDPEKNTRLHLPLIPRITIGRGSDNDIIIRHPIVSRQHGELIWQDGIHIYRDLNSANGSYINNQVVTEPMPLTINSVLGLGESVRLRYQEISSDSLDGTDEMHAILHDSQVNTSLTPLPRAGLYMSNHSEDQEQAEMVVQLLREANFHVFWRAEIPVGTSTEDAIDTNLKYSDVMVVWLSSDQLASTPLSEEWNRFIAMRKPLVIIQPKQVTVPSILSDQTIIRYNGDPKALKLNLVGAIMEIIR